MSTERALTPASSTNDMVRGQQASPLDQFLGKEAPPYFTNIDERSPFGRALVARCEMTDTEKVGDWFNKPFPTTYVYVTFAAKANEKTGEIEEWIRSVLIDDKGRTLGFGSSGVLKSLRRITKQHGCGPWTPPLGLILKQEQLGGGRQFYYLCVEGEDLETLAKGGSSGEPKREQKR